MFSRALIIAFLSQIPSLTCVIAPQVAASQEAVPSTGLVVSVAGEVVIHRPAGSEPAIEGFVLQEADTVVVKSGATCSGFTPRGDHFDLQGPAEIILSKASEPGLLGSVASWIRLQIAQWIGEGRRQPLTTRSIRDWEVQIQVPAPMIPAPRGQVRPSGARFLWTTIPGIDRYDVILAPTSGKESSRALRGNRVVINDLAAGERYVWKVLPHVEEWHAEARWRAFRVMTREEENRLDQALQSLGDLEAGVLLLSAGLHEEAVYRFDAAVASGERARSARRWRAQALADLGLYKQAFEDLIESGGRE